MRFSTSHLRKLLRLQAKFFTSSILATGVDYALFFLLDWVFFGPVAAHAISYPIAVLVNYFLQKQFIFEMRRKPGTAFAMAMALSAAGWGIGTALLFFLVKIPLFATAPVLAKLLVTGLLFFYNFYGKRFAFEKRFF